MRRLLVAASLLVFLLSLYSTRVIAKPNINIPIKRSSILTSNFVANLLPFGKKASGERKLPEREISNSESRITWNILQSKQSRALLMKKSQECFSAAKEEFLSSYKYVKSGKTIGEKVTNLVDVAVEHPKTTIVCVALVYGLLIGTTESEKT